MYLHWVERSQKGLSIQKGTELALKPIIPRQLINSNRLNIEKHFLLLKTFLHQTTQGEAESWQTKYLEREGDMITPRYSTLCRVGTENFCSALFYQAFIFKKVESREDLDELYLSLSGLLPLFPKCLQRSVQIYKDCFLAIPPWQELANAANLL